MKIIRISKGKAVSLPIRIMAVVITVITIVKVVELLPESGSIIIVMLLAALLPAFWFATKIIVINEENKTIFDGVWTMGKKLGKAEKYDAIKEIMIEKVKIKETVYTLPNKQNIVSNHEYRAYLKTSAESKYFLLSHPIKGRLDEKVTKIKEKLEIN